MNPSSQFELIIFDWDGTLMDSVPHIVKTIHQAFTQLDLPPPTAEQSKHIIGLALVEAFPVLHPGLEAPVYQALVDAYLMQDKKVLASVPLFDDVTEGLFRLKDAGVKLAIATGKRRKGLEASLAVSGLDTTLFDCTRTVDECASKPHPEMLLSIMQELGAIPEKTIMIGDTSHDLTMANRARIASAGVSYGAHSSETLQQCSPVKVFDAFRPLTDWLLEPPELS